MTGPERFDGLARARAGGVSRRQVLARAARLAAAASPLGALLHSPAPAHASSAHTRGAICHTCQVGHGFASCAPCSGRQRGPTAAQMARIGARDRSYRRLEAYAHAHHFRASAVKLVHVKRSDATSYTGLEIEMTGPGGTRGALLLFAVGTHGVRHPISVFVQTTGDPHEPSAAVIARPHGRGTISVDPWSRKSARRLAVDFGFQPDETSGPRPGPVAHAADLNCDAVCSAICSQIDKLCGAGIMTAVGDCPLKTPIGAAVCSAAAIIACRLAGVDAASCQKYLCGPMCGCPRGSMPCPSGPLGYACVPITEQGNCGDCGVTCQAPLTCVGDPLDWASYHCGCPPGKCPSNAPPDPNNNCQCSECSALEYPSGCSGTDVCCGTTCVDLMTDDNNCGICGLKCTNGSTCDQGQCCGEVCSNPSACCPPGTHCCVDVPGHSWQCCINNCCGAYHTCNSHC